MIQIVEKAVEIQLPALALPLHQGCSQLSGHITGTSCHTQQAAVQNVSAAAVSGHRVRRAHAHIGMAVEANGYLDRPLHRLHAGTHLIGEHTAGGIHQGNLVDAGSLQNAGLLGQLNIGMVKHISIITEFFDAETSRLYYRYRDMLAQKAAQLREDMAQRNDEQVAPLM